MNFDTTTHLRAGRTEPARWNELCIPQKYWRMHPATVALRDSIDDVTCRMCLSSQWRQRAGEPGTEPTTIPVDGPLPEIEEPLPQDDTMRTQEVRTMPNDVSKWAGWDEADPKLAEDVGIVNATVADLPGLNKRDLDNAVQKRLTPRKPGGSVDLGRVNRAIMRALAAQAPVIARERQGHGWVYSAVAPPTKKSRSHKKKIEPPTADVNPAPENV